MFNVPNDFKTEINKKDRVLASKISINGVDFFDDAIGTFTRTSSTQTGQSLEIGEVIASTFNFELRTMTQIPPNAEIRPYIKVVGVDYWLPLGVYKTNYRETSTSKDGYIVYKFTCLDRLVEVNQKFVSGLTYPNTMQAVLDEMLGQLGFELKAGVSINPSYEVPYKDEDITLRDMFSYIASAHGCSVRLTNDGKVEFIKYVPTLPDGSDYELVLTDNMYKELKETGVKTNYTRLRVVYNSDNEEFLVGTGGEENTLNVYNPFMTEAMALTVLSGLTGLSYTPFNTFWQGNLYNECGDFITLVDRFGKRFNSFIGNSTIVYAGGLYETIVTNGLSPDEAEYKYEGNLKKIIPKSGLQEDEPYYGVTIGRAKGLNIKKSDGSSEVTFNSDELAWKVGNQDILYFDALRGTLVFDGHVSMESLSAETGSIAELTVDSLETSKRVQKYLNNDDSVDEYIRINNKSIEFISASVVDGAGSVQEMNRNGELLFWTDENHTGTTVRDTGIPVMTYVYEKLVKLRLSYDKEGGGSFDNPVIDLGVGDGVTPLSGKVRILKDGDGLKVTFYNPNNEKPVGFLIGVNKVEQFGGTGSLGMRNIAVQSTAPENPQNNDLWIQTS